MSLRGKLLLAQLPLVVALGVVGAMAAVALSSLGGSPRTILQDNYRSVLAAERMKDAVDRIQTSLLGLGAEPTADVVADVALERGRFETELRAEEGNVTEPGEEDAARRLRSAWRVAEAAIDEQMSPVPQRAREDAARARLRSSLGAVKARDDEIIALNQAAMVRKSAQAADDARLAVERTGLTALAAFLLASFASFALISRVLGPLWLLKQTVARVGEGDFDTSVVVTGNDELAQLAASVNAMARRLQDYRQTSQGRLALVQRASQAAIDSIPDPVIVFDAQGAVLLANAAARLLASAREANPAERALAALDPALRSAVLRVRDHVLSSGSAFVPQGFEDAVRFSSRSGDDHYYLPRGTTVPSSMEGVAGATVILQDVTALRLAYELRNDLVATVAHEFRTPLTSIRLATHMCLEGAAGPIGEKQSELLHAAREECVRLEAVIDQLLDLARIQAGRIDGRQESVSAQRLVADALGAQEIAAKDRRIELRSSVPPGLPHALVDRGWIRLVFSNLLTNAVRHSSPGATVSLAALRDAQDGLLRFEVKDSAGGIPEEFRGVIFDRFRQVPGAPAGSLGLGLSIARDIVEAHGGRIGVESTEGEGSTFWFTLPAAPRTSPEATASG
jgi:signal transduction histidine kinase/HAMP domain-containing protein